MASKLERLQARKVRMIDRILRLHDRADATNDRIYQLSCDIERMNLEIDLARAEEERKKAVKIANAPPGAAPRNGTASPP